MKKLEMLYWPISKLTKYHNNTKTHPDTQIEKIARSIELYGFDQPISVDRDGIIIKGHGRLMAAKLLGIDIVPVIVRDDLTRIQAAASRIADNKVAESPWDEYLLPMELKMLEEADFDLLQTGFEAKEINKIMGNLDFSSDTEDGGESTNASTDDDGDKHVKMIQLFYDTEQDKLFRDAVSKLSEIFLTENMSDTVYKALLYAEENLSKENEETLP